MKRQIIATMVFLACCFGAVRASDPTDQSSWGLIRWIELSGFIASGSGLPAVATDGSRFVDWATPSTPVEYIATGGAWVAISGGGSGSGVSTHSLLTNLDYSSSGHTGFQPSASMTDYQLAASMSDYQPIASMSDYQPVASMSPYSLVASLDAHVADQEDPHGATETITQGITLGSGTADASVYRSATNTITIASFACLPVVTATPSGTIATGTIWMGTATLYLYVNGDWSAIGP